jgi:hypothetical protein
LWTGRWRPAFSEIFVSGWKTRPFSCRKRHCCLPRSPLMHQLSDIAGIRRIPALPRSHCGDFGPRRARAIEFLIWPANAHVQTS